MKFFLRRFIFIPIFISTSFNDAESKYDREKQQISQVQNDFRSRWMAARNKKESLLKSAGTYFEESLTKKIFPYWYGTAWDFNGYTANPKEGSIACGYFVSTTLQHAGFKLNRYRLAQQPAYGIVKTLSCGDSIYSFYNTTREKFISKTKSKLDTGLYVIGLDNHVGFLIRKKDSLFFIHSTYLKPSRVIRALADTSAALKYSQTFLLTEINYNTSLMLKWIEGGETEDKIIVL
jgi:hypothetical protein